MKLGIYAGSFDPIHSGHIGFAEASAAACGLDQVVFMPEAFPRNKPNVTPLSERLSELEIALSTTPFIVLNSHIDHFSVDPTLTELEALYPSSALTFLLGSDVVLGSLANWDNVERLLSRHTLAVGMRDNDRLSDVETVLKKLGANYTIVKTPYAHISSSELRK